MKIATTILTWILIGQISIAQNIVEKYYRSGFNNSGTIELYDNGTFIHKSGAVSCVIEADGKMKSMSSEIHGEYNLKDDHIYFSPKYKLYKGYKDEEPQRSNEYIKEEVFFGFSYDIIEYKGTKLLIANKKLFEFAHYDFRFDNQYIYLANKINATDKSTDFNWEFWRNKPFEPKDRIVIEKDIVELFPKGYKGYILSEPIVTKIEEIEEVSFLNPNKEANPQWKKYKITLDVGKNDGVRPMMIFYGDEKCDGVRDWLTIEEVTEDECVGYREKYYKEFECKVGIEFSTKKEREKK